MASTFSKDPNAVLDFATDWSEWLASGETILSHTVTVPTGITKESDSESAGIVTVWLSGGTTGISYAVVFQIITSDSRTDERTITINCQER